MLINNTLKFKSMTQGRRNLVARSENPRGLVVMRGDNVPIRVEIG